MADYRQHTRRAELATRRRHRAIGAAAAVGTILALGLATPPAARADDLGLGDLIGDLLGSTGDATVGDTTVAADAFFQQSVYDPLHTTIENWIKSPFGTQVDDLINTFAPKGEIFIGNGTAGTSAADPDGENVLWVGDGGAGWNSTAAGVAGGTGGAGGIFGNGGAGGAGGADASGGAGGDGGSLLGIGGAGGNGGAGGDGGDGGAATGLFGDGGNGGNAGAGGSGLPALGGAGGNGGVLGEHGTVGDHGTPAGGPPSTDTAGLSTTGPWITDGDGQVVILHGLNEVYKIPPFEPSAAGFSAADAKFLEDNGFNMVRLGVIWAGVEPEPGVFNDAYLASIEQTVQILAAHHIHVLLDMHQDAYSSVFGGEGAPAWATQTGGLPYLPGSLASVLTPAFSHAWGAFWSNADAPNGIGLENDYAQMWEHVADYFKGNPDVAGYEIMNEPYPFGSPDSLFNSSHFGAQELTPFYNQVDSAIRAVDPNTPVFFEPNIIAQFTPIHLGTVDDPHSVLSFHDYCMQAWFLDTDIGCTALTGAGAERAEAYAESHDIPVMMTEFGATDNLPSITDEEQLADQGRFGWTYWAFTGKDDITTATQSTEGLVYNPHLPPTGDNVDTAKLATLAQPYPELISGTPNSWSFEHGTFHFSYSTEMADGQGSFAAGSQTTISVPKIEFPHGYQVNVTGGQVISAANAPELVIASQAGAGTVTVMVSSSADGGAAAG